MQGKTAELRLRGVGCRDYLNDRERVSSVELGAYTQRRRHFGLHRERHNRFTYCRRYPIFRAAITDIRPGRWCATVGR